MSDNGIIVYIECRFITKIHLHCMFVDLSVRPSIDRPRGRSDFTETDTIYFELEILEIFTYPDAKTYSSSL